MLALLALLLSAEPAACDAGPCVERHYLLPREGKQCGLRALSAVAAEKERVGPAALDAWVSYALDPKLLPAACVPKNVKPFVKKQACAECGCPQTWFFCIRSAGDPAVLRKLGYVAVVE